MSFSVKLGNFLYRNVFVLYKPLYFSFKKTQDAYEIKLLRKFVRKNDIVLDIGANIGFYAGMLARMVGNGGQVHCFEPDKTNFAHLKKGSAGFKNIVLNNKAVGPKTEMIKIYTSKDLNVDHRTYKPEEFDAEMEIESVAIDDYLQNAPKVDFIKMDIQGFEMQALRGMERTLDLNKEVKIISEFWPYGLRTAGSSVTDYYGKLTSKGFKCYLLNKDHLELLTMERVQAMEILGKKFYFNIIASRQDV
jgi:FkbM family methyltransferase